MDTILFTLETASLLEMSH